MGSQALLTSLTRAAAEAVPQFTCSSYPCQITGSNTIGNEVFTTEGGKVECDSHWLSHKINGPTSTLTLTPTTTGCQAFGFLSATESSEGCTYVLHATEKVSAGVCRLHGDISCPAGKSIKITASSCKAEVKGQTGLTTVKATNSGGSIILNWELLKMSYTVTQDGFLCPFNGTGNKTDGQFTGAVTTSRIGGGSIEISGS